MLAARDGNGSRVGISPVGAVAHYIHNLHLVSVLDELRDAYELCKEQRHPELQSLLLGIRRRLLEALHESLNLYSENAELHQQLNEAQAEIRELREGARAPLTAESTPRHGPRKLS